MSVEKGAWEKRTMASGFTSDNKPLQLVRWGAGFELRGCGTHNPVIAVCVWPRKYFLDFVSNGVTLGTVPLPSVYPYLAAAVYTVDEKRCFIKMDQPGAVIIRELTVGSDKLRDIAGIPYTYDTTPAAEKQELRVSVRGKYAAWSEPSGLMLVNLGENWQKRLLPGIPAREPVFSNDEKEVSFKIWLDTAAAQSNVHGIDLGTLRPITVSQQYYDKGSERYIVVSTTTEYAGIAHVELETSRLIRTEKPGYSDCYREDCKDAFEPYRYRQTPF